MAEKRYVAEIELFIFATDDKEARRKAKVIEAILQDIDDNEAKVTELWLKEFGQIGLEKVGMED